MSLPKNSLKQYYGESGEYLKEHESFLNSSDLQKDLSFLTDTLKFKKSDIILDIACGQGRHSNALSEKGYNVDGVDFSEYLLKIAEEESKKNIVNKPSYFFADIEKMELAKKYTKAYWFFSDLGNLNIQRALASLSKNLEINGEMLIDTDNIFRIVSFLQKKHNPDYSFDAQKLELFDVKNNVHVQYPVIPMWNMWLTDAGFSLEKVFGDYELAQYTINSPRMILLIKKTAQIQNNG